jgi:probable F420-dependent oxidoreductase
VRFWQAVAFLPTDELLEVARMTEDAGYHGITVSDHIFYPERLSSPYPYSADGAPIWAPSTPWPDPWVLIGAMAAATTSLRFTTNIYVAPARNHFVVAKAVATASVLSDERVALGLAAGWMREEFDACGEDFGNRGRRLDELVEVLRALWRGGMQGFHGTYYDFEPVEISPVPRQPIPMYGGGDSDPAMRRAARLDGWIGNAYQPEEALRQVERLGRFRRSEGTLDRPDYEVMLALLAPPDVGLYRRMQDAGVTSMICAPWMLAPGATEGAGPSRSPADRAGALAAKRKAIEGFADAVIARMG